jgi:hypothetical protein
MTSGDDRQTVEQLARELAEVRSRYAGLRSRKAVRAALAIADLRHRRLGGLARPRRATPPPPQAATADGAEAPATEIEPPATEIEPPATEIEPPENVEPPLICWPLDHYYSPVPDNRALAREPARSRVWPPRPRATPGIDWREEQQVALVRDTLALQPECVFPSGPTGDPRDYHAGSEMFSRLDAWLLQGILRHFRPRRMIEVGCGWSSLVTARVNREYLGNALHFTCIEPYPPDFLGEGIDGITELIASPVEELSIDPFLQLGDGDVLFIDSSHTVKTGGDVVFLFEEVLPRLAPGVVVHIHDIFLPFDYPQEWVMTGRAWNEQYLVRSFLAFNSAFDILVGVGWMTHNHPEVLAEAIPGYPGMHRDGGGSLWIRRTEPASSRQLPDRHSETGLNIGDLGQGIDSVKARLDAARTAAGGDIPWYPYDILGNVSILDGLLHGVNRDLSMLARDLPVADIGGADGDLAFALEQLGGWEVDLIDTAATNMNGLAGARALRDQLGSKVRIHDIDLDTQFELPRERYGLVFLLGIVYHLQNPFYVLRELSGRTEHCLLSTRVARFAGDERTPIADLPLGYLVGPAETNNDPTNYWMFSPTGLERLVTRSGWSVLERSSIGDTEASDPSSAEHDERMFLLLRSDLAG